MRTHIDSHVHLSSSHTSPVGNRLLDRYVLPKVAMALIVVSTAAGVWLTLIGIGAGQLDLVVARWIHFLSLSAVLGGSLWGAFYTARRYEAQDLEPPQRFLQLEFTGFATILQFAAVIAGIAGTYVLVRYAVSFGATYSPWYNGLIGLEGALWLGLWALVAAVPSRLRTDRTDWPTPLQRRLKQILVLAAVILLGTATLDVVPRAGFDGLTIFVRWIHLMGLSAWFGGAIWNVFVAVPAARRTLSFETVFAAASQLEQFRKVVRIALPLVLVSGLYQAYLWIGVNVSALTSLPVGALIALKLGLIVALVGIFIACPMWRACSPIAGVCDITDIDPTPTTGGERTRSQATAY